MQLYSSHLVTILLFLFQTLTCDDSIDIEDESPLQLSVTTSVIIGNDAFFEIIDPPELEYTYRIRPAKDFGRAFTSDFRLQDAKLVLVDPPHGCSAIKNHKSVYGNVALIDRGECSFLTKAINAEKAGARVVIVTENNVDSPEYDFYIEMVHDKTSKDIKIPAAFLLGKNGRIIKETLSKLKRSYAVINLPQNLTFVPAHRINHPPWLTW